ncbi:hypothetical protein TNCV_2308961 [Trichonephila clavipes]|nr:hypothetical protein TNCV_2308961 [Trichonephila clavipes]
MAEITCRSTVRSTEVQVTCRRANKSICVVTTSQYTCFMRWPHKKNQTVSTEMLRSPIMLEPNFPCIAANGLKSRHSMRTSFKNIKCDCPESRSGNKQHIWSSQVIPENASPHFKRPNFLLFLRPNCMWIDLGPHMAVEMVEYPITNETCTISPQDIGNETIIYVLLPQQPFTEGHAFLTVI